MRTLTLLACGCLLAGSLPLRAQEQPREPATGAVADATASNYNLQLTYLNASPFEGDVSDLDYGLLLSDEHNVVASAAWMYRTNLDVIPGLHIDAGPKAYVASLAEQNRGIFSLAVGADAVFNLIPPLGLQVFGSAYYGPSVFMFGAADNLYDLTAGGQIRFAKGFMAQAGYRWFRYTLQHSPNDTVQNNLFVGVRWDMQ